MPEIRYTGGGHYRVDGYGFDAGDVRDVDDDLFGYLEDHEDFEVVEDAGDDGVHEEDPLEGKSVAEVDVSEHLDRWLDQPYDHRAEQVRGGGVDDSLDAIEDAETSQTVIDAVEERRDKLEG